MIGIAINFFGIRIALSVASRLGDNFSDLCHPFCALERFSTPFSCCNGILSQVPTGTDCKAFPKFMPSDFDELNVNAVIAASFSIFHLEDCVPYYADQYRKSLQMGLEFEVM